jgi:protein MpaA
MAIIVKQAITSMGNKLQAFTNGLITPTLNQQPIEYIYLLAGTHGDEIESTYVLNQLLKQEYFDKLSYPIIFVPEVNPDGLILNTRVNANKVDLNRNFKTSDWSHDFIKERYFPGVSPNSEVETIFLIELFELYKPKFILSFHSWKRILNNNNHPQAVQIAKLIAQYNQYPIDTDIGYETPGSLGSYTNEVLGCGILTYELPIADNIALTLDQVWLENRQGLQIAMEFLKTTYV